MIRSMMSLIIFVITAYALFSEAVGVRPIYSIKSEDGDVIDCFYIHEQPALAHPLLKNHKIQMRANHLPVKAIDSGKIAQTWQKSGNCPSGTVPILRKNYNMSNEIIPDVFNTLNVIPNAKQEEVSGYAINSNFYTATGGDLYIYNTIVGPNEFSLSYVGIGATSTYMDKRTYPYQIPKSLSAGWMVYPSIFGDSSPRLFALARNENTGTACLNYQCGFVQVDNTYVLGAALNAIPKISTEIYLDASTNNWWLRIMNVNVGYWPNMIAGGSLYGNMLKWGGLVLNTMPGGLHTTTTMGSGQFPNFGSSQSGMIAEIEFASKNSMYGGGMQPLQGLDGSIVTSPNCYNYRGQIDPYTNRFVMLYGGPGGMYCDYSRKI